MANNEPDWLTWYSRKLLTSSYPVWVVGLTISEYQRQISIAQKGCDWIESMQIIPEEHSQITEIIGKQTVAQWAAKYEPVKSTIS